MVIALNIGSVLHCVGQHSDGPLSRLGSCTFNFSRRRAADGELLQLADPAPPSRTDCPRAQGRHRPNKPPPASAAAHHISAGPPPDAIRPRREQTRCSHFGSQAIPHPLLQPLAHFQQPADRGTAAPPTSLLCPATIGAYPLPSYKWRRRSLSLALQ